MTKRFEISPIDPIKNGTFAYSFDAEKKLLHYELHGLVKKWFVSKKIDETGSQPMEPKDLASAKYAKVGAPIQFANLAGHVVSIKNQIATVQIGLVGMKAEGTATFSLAGTYVELMGLDVSGSIYGLSFRIVLTPMKAFAKRG